MLKVIGSGLFANHFSNWFAESLFTWTRSIHVIRAHKILFIQNRASLPLATCSLIIVSVGAWLTVSPLAGTLGFLVLSPLYWLLLAGLMVSYVILTQPGEDRVLSKIH